MFGVLLLLNETHAECVTGGPDQIRPLIGNLMKRRLFALLCVLWLATCLAHKGDNLFQDDTGPLSGKRLELSVGSRIEQGRT